MPAASPPCDDGTPGVRASAASSAEDPRTYPHEMTAAAVQVPAPVVPRVPGFILVMSGLALTSGTIHLVAAIEHVGDNALLGAFFAFVGAAQLCAAWWIFHRHESARVLGLVAVGSIAVSLLWVFSRTTGIAFGPEPGRASVGVADTITTLQQFALAAIAVALLRNSAGDRGLAWLGGPLATRMTFALLTTMMLLAAVGGHEH